MPSAERVAVGAPPPALLTNTSRRGYFCRISSASARTDACDDMSAISRSTCEDPDSRRISSSAAFPFSAFRQTMTTRAPIRARPSAVSFPIPLFAPVTIHIFPLIFPGGITYDLANVLVYDTTDFWRGGRQSDGLKSTRMLRDYRIRRGHGSTAAGASLVADPYPESSRIAAWAIPPGWPGIWKLALAPTGALRELPD